MTDKKSIVEEYMAKGRLLTPEALDYIFSKGATPGETTELLISLNPAEVLQDHVRVLKNLSSKPKEIVTEDFIQFYSSKYEKMKNIITARMQKNFLSLNKLDALRNEVFVLGIVKDIREKDGKTLLELEDPTTSVSVIFEEKADVELDDVVAVRAVSAGKILYGKEVIYPDIPLRAPVRGKGKACFVADLHTDQTPKADAEKFFEWFAAQSAKYLFIAGDIGEKPMLSSLVKEYCSDRKVFVIPGEADTDKEYPQLAEDFQENNIISLSNPAMVEINGVKILLIHKFDINMLKRRYLGKSKVILPEDYLVLEEVPDIVHCGATHQPYVTNYKSVTIVNAGSPLSDFRPVVVDLATRDVSQEKVV